MPNCSDSKVIQIKARVTSSQHADLVRQAKTAGITLSDLLRQRAVNKTVISRADSDAAKSIDQVGRMLKYYYPKDKGWASAEDRRKWWRLVDELQDIARAIRRGGRS